MGQFIPKVAPAASPGVQQMMGTPTGGYMPSQAEAITKLINQSHYARFVQDVYRTDPRAGSAVNLLLQSLYGGDERAKRQLVEKFGGQQGLHEYTGMLINSPAVSRFFGGSFTSMAIGSAAIAGSGVRIGSGLSIGDGYIQSQAARAIYDQVRGQFFSGSGSANIYKTSGLDATQIGGIMTVAGAQGAFSGVDVGDFGVGKIAQFKTNPEGLKQIGKFVENAAATLSTIIDIFGKGSVEQLLGKAQQITGLDFSRMGNAEVMRQRLFTLKNVARVSGYDSSTVMDLAAQSVQLANAYGVTGDTAGTVGEIAASRASRYTRQMQAGDNFMYLPRVGMQQFAGDFVRDQAALFKDPLGLRRSAMQLMVQNGMITGEARDSILAGAGPDQASLSRIDRQFSATAGMSLTSAIRTLGGSSGIMQGLNNESQRAVSIAMGDDMRGRQSEIIRRMISNMGMSGEAGGDMYSILTQLSGDTANSLLSGKSPNLLGETMPAELTAAAGRLRSKYGELAPARFRTAMLAMRNNPLTRSFLSTQDLTDARMREMAITQNVDLSHVSNLRGLIGGKDFVGGLTQGMLDRLNFSDPTSVFTTAMAFRPKSVIGGAMGFELDFTGKGDPMQQLASMEHYSNPELKSLMRREGIVLNASDPAARAESALRLGQILKSPVERARVFQDYRVANSSRGALLMRSAEFASMSQMGAKPLIAARVAQQLSGSGDPYAQSFVAAAKAMADPNNFSSSEDSERLMSAYARLTQKFGVPMGLNVAGLKEIAKLDPALGAKWMQDLQLKAEELSSRKNKWYEFGSEQDLATIQERIQALKDAGIAGQSLPTLTRSEIIGTLELGADSKARLTGFLTQQSK